jgi:hypothetical protein
VWASTPGRRMHLAISFLWSFACPPVSDLVSSFLRKPIVIRGIPHSLEYSPIEECRIMFGRLRRSVWFRGMGLSIALLTSLCASQARASIVIFASDPEVTGGTFLTPDRTVPPFSPDRLSFSVTGDYSFTADATSATVTISTYLLTLNPQGTFHINTSIDGFFASDLVNPKSEITTYSASSYLFNFGGSPIAQVPLPGTTASVAIANLPQALPTTAANFPMSSLELKGSASTLATLPTDTFGLYLGQLTTIQFDLLTVGETIRIDLPDDTSLTPAAANVPEPRSFVLWGLGSLLAAAAGGYRKLTAGFSAT